jgi:hypothetical protein
MTGPYITKSHAQKSQAFFGNFILPLKSAMKIILLLKND